MGVDSTHGVGAIVNSGLPDIQGTHKIGCGDKSSGGTIISSNSTTGAFYSARDGRAIFSAGTIESTSDNHRNQVGFKASNYNSIYGASSIVQPPAFFCYFWKRLS